MFSRRELLAASAMGAAIGVSAPKAGSFGNPDESPQGAINAKGPGNLVDPRPPNAVIGSQFPSAQSAPATDVGGMPLTWASFNASKRTQNGGWAREVTVNDFAISKEIAGVNMRLTAGGIRRHRLREAELRALCGKCQRHRSAIHRCFSRSALRGVLALQLARAYAAETGGAVSQGRRSDDREMASQRSRHHAESVGQNATRTKSQNSPGAAALPDQDVLQRFERAPPSRTFASSRRVRCPNHRRAIPRAHGYRCSDVGGMIPWNPH